MKHSAAPVQLIAFILASLIINALPASAFEVIGSPHPLTPTSAIEVRFENPMVAEGAVGKETDQPPVVSKPAIDAHFIWDSNRSGRLIFHSPPQIGAKFEFSPRPGLKDVEGRKVTAEKPAELQSSSFRVVSRQPRYFSSYGDSLSRNRSPQFVLEFNDNIDPTTAGRSIFFEDKSGARIAAKVTRPKAKDFPEGHSHPKTWDEQFRKAIEDNRATEGEEERPEKPKRKFDNALKISPQIPLPVGEDWELIVATGTPASSGAAETSSQYKVRLGDLKPFSVRSVYARSPYDGGRSFSVYFSKQFEEGTTAESISDWINVSPSPDDMKLTLQGTVLQITGSFLRNKSYQVVVRPGLQAADLTMLRNGYNKTFTFTPNEPYLSIPAFEATQISTGRKQFGIAAGNLDNVKVRVKRLNGDELPYALRGYERYHNNAQGNTGLTYDLVPGRTAYEKTLISKKEIDQAEKFNINWDEILGKGNKHGAIFVHVEGTPKNGTGHRRKMGAQALIQISDIGIVTKSGRDNSLVFAFSHETGEALKGVNLNVVDRENQVIATAKTDANGVADLPFSDKAHWISATHGADRHMVSFGKQMSTLPTWRYRIPVEWRRPPEVRRRTFLFIDRPVYRPGDTVHLKGYARQLLGDDYQIDAGAKAKLQLRDSRYRTIFEREITLNKLGSLAEDLTIPASGALGRYSIKLDFNESGVANSEYRSRYANIGFEVADYRPNTFEVKLKGDDPATLDKTAHLDLIANYYMGKSLSDAQVVWHSSIRSAGFRPRGYEKFVFGGGTDFSEKDDEEEDAEEIATYGEILLGKDGKASLDVPIPSANGEPGARIFRVTTEVTDVNQQTVAASKSMRIEGSQYYIGIARPPYLNSTDKAMPVTLVALDADGKPMEEAVDAKVTIERTFYQTVRQKSVGGGTVVKNERKTVKASEQNVSIAPVGEAVEDKDIAPTLQFTPKQSGSYTITVESKDAAGNPVRSGTYFYVYGGMPSWAVQDGTGLEMIPEKSDYLPGDTAKILLKTPVSGTALVTMERTGVLDHFLTEVDAENPVLEVPISKHHSPNVFVSVMLVRGAANTGKKFPQPDYRMGYCQLKVKSNDHQLDVAVTSDRSEYRPGENVTLQASVHDAEGNPVQNAEVTLYAVDEGVLSLMGYATPNPNPSFHSPVSLAVRTAISLTRLLSENPDDWSYDNKGFMVGGGGGEGEGQRQTMRKKFKACAYWASSLMTDENGNVTGKFVAPDNLTRFRTIAVVAAEDARFGSADGAIVVNKPLMIDPVVPRFANLSDKVNVKAVVHNTSTASGEFEITLTLGKTARFQDGTLLKQPELTGGPKPLPAADRTMRRTIRLDAGDTGRIAFPVTFEKLGTARWVWSAKPVKVDKEVRGLNDKVESKFEVRTPLPLLRESRYITLDRGGPNGNILSPFSPELLQGEGDIVVTLSKTRLLEAKDATDYVLKYPYGCAEQTTSSLLPWVKLRELRRALPSFSKHGEEDIKAALQKGADRILSMQTNSGGLAYWPGGSSPQLWASAYAGMGLILAEKAGADVPENSIDELKKWLSKELRNVSSEGNQTRLTNTALALYTLAIGGSPEEGYHDIMFKRRADLSNEARILLALAIAEADGDKKAVNTLLTEEPNEDPDRIYWTGRSFGEALNLLAWAKFNPDSDMTGKSLEELLNARNSRGTWGSTWNNAWAMMAMGTYAASEKITEGPVTVAYALGSESGKMELAKGLSSTNLTLSYAKDDPEQPLKISLPADANVYAHVEVKAYPKLVPQKPRANGMTIRRIYQKVLPNGELVPAEDLQIGDMVQVRLNIEIPKRASYIAVDDPLPAVFEAVNPEFATQASREVDQQGWRRWYSDFEELRADRALFFRDHLSSGGRFSLSYLARVIAEGDTIAPPAKVEEMYHPDNFGLSASWQVETK